MKRVLVGLSGGVDSAVSAYLLKEQGYEVIGIYMILHKNDMYHAKNIENVKIISEKLGIKYVVEDVSEEFKKKVYDYFVESYKQGLTPNPCAMCNREIKFGDFVKFMDKYETDFIATGHYVKNDGKFLYKAEDLTKDQSYFLFGIKKELLPKIIFPLGEYKKVDIKKIASDIGMVSLSNQKESQDICFVETDYIDVLNKHFPTQKKGKIVDIKGKVVGSHRGYVNYTIGQRKGLKLFKSHKPHFVVDIDPDRNTLIVSSNKEFLDKKIVFARDVNLFSEDNMFEADVKVRYRADAKKAKVRVKKDKIAEIVFSEPVSAVANGQAAVFYDGDKLLGGGWIYSSQKGSL